MPGAIREQGPDTLVGPGLSTGCGHCLPGPADLGAGWVAWTCSDRRAAEGLAPSVGVEWIQPPRGSAGSFLDGILYCPEALLE